MGFYDIFNPLFKEQIAAFQCRLGAVQEKNREERTGLVKEMRSVFEDVREPGSRFEVVTFDNQSQKYYIKTFTCFTDSFFRSQRSINTRTDIWVFESPARIITADMELVNNPVSAQAYRESIYMEA